MSFRPLCDDNTPTGIMIVLFGLFLLFIILIPVGLAYLVFRLLRKKGYKKVGLAILAIVTIWTVYSSYTAFHPTNSFYKDEFEYNTGLDFPKSGDILTKDASYPDLHGDYSAAAVFKTDQEDFKQILTAIQKDSKFQLDTIPFKFNLANFDKTVEETSFNKCFTLNRQGRDLVFTISFNDKDDLIAIQRDSW